MAPCACWRRKDSLQCIRARGRGPQGCSVLRKYTVESAVEFYRVPADEAIKNRLPPC
jgi:hypothetical protein